MNVKNWLTNVYVIKDLFWIFSICEWGCDKLSDIWQYLNYENYKCRKKK